MRRLQSGILIVGFSLLIVAMITNVHAQTGNYPDKLVTIISDSAPGSTPDVKHTLSSRPLDVCGVADGRA
jgi:hypothetical protein